MAVGDVFKKRRNLVQQSSASKPGAGSGLFSYNTGAGMNPYVPNSPMATNAQPQMQNPMVPSSMLQSSGRSGSQMLGDRMQAASMRGLASQLDALREQSQIRFPSNPMSPTFGVVNPDVESARRLAPMLAQDAARQQNTPMNGMTAYEANPMRYNPTDPAIQARQQDNAQRMAGGFLMDRTRGDGGARFAGSAGRINAEYDKVQAGQGIFNNGQFLDFTPTGTPESARAAQLAGKTERELLRDRSNMNVPQSELDRRDDADTARRERQARHNQFKDANSGMNYRQYDRLQRQNALTMKAVDEGRLSPEAANFRMQTRADKALRRAGNPMLMGTDESRRFFPDMMAGKGGPQAPQNKLVNPIFGLNTSGTPAGKLAAAGNVNNMAATDPNIVALGVDPNAGISGLHSALAQQFEDDPNLAMDDSSLRSYQMFAQQSLTADPDQANPSNFTSFPGSVFTETEGAVTSDLWKELATMPDNERARQQWLQKYKNRQQEIDKRQTEYYGSYGS